MGVELQRNDTEYKLVFSCGLDTFQNLNLRSARIMMPLRGPNASANRPNADPPGYARNTFWSRPKVYLHSPRRLCTSCLKRSGIHLSPYINVMPLKSLLSLIANSIHHVCAYSRDVFKKFTMAVPERPFETQSLGKGSCGERARVKAETVRRERGSLFAFPHGVYVHCGAVNDCRHE